MIVVEVERRRDGKLHPPGGHRSAEEIARLVWRVHELRCQEDLSFRRIVAQLAAQGSRVSLGSAWHYWAGWQCRECAEDG
jgi:hypothetical protein